MNKHFVPCYIDEPSGKVTGFKLSDSFFIMYF